MSKRDDYPHFFTIADGLRAMNFDFDMAATYSEDESKAIIKDNIDLEDANLVTSKFGSNTHKVVLDIDMDACLQPSTTPGHFHLIIDKELPWEDYVKLLTVLAEVGIIEEGYASASIKKGYTAIRTPWTKKVKDKGVDMVKAVEAAKTKLLATGGLLKDKLNVATAIPIAPAVISGANTFLVNQYVQPGDTITIGDPFERATRNPADTAIKKNTEPVEPETSEAQSEQLQNLLRKI